MSLQLKNLISQILLDHFGDIVQKVGVSLFQSGRQPVMVISKSCNLPKSQVCYLINFILNCQSNF